MEVGCVFSVVTQRSSFGGALRDDTKNGCMVDYPPGGFAGYAIMIRFRPQPGQVQIKMMGHLTITRSRNV